MALTFERHFVNLRQLISSSLAILLGLTSANAYVAEHLQQGEAAHQIDAVIVLDENGKPRCKIISNGFLLSERFHEFVERNPEAEEVLDKLNALEKCDDGDELYAEFEPGPQEISMAGAPSPGKALAVGLAAGKAWAKSGGPVVALLSFGLSCAVKKGEYTAIIPLFFLTGVMSGFYGSEMAALTKLGMGSFSLSFLATMFSGFLISNAVCGPETTKRTIKIQ